MIFWSVCAFIWFKNMKKMLLQMTSGFLQLESTLVAILIHNHFESLNRKNIVYIGRSNEILGRVGVGKIKPFRTVSSLIGT
jgi:hypothetical protein